MGQATLAIYEGTVLLHRRGTPSSGLLREAGARLGVKTKARVEHWRIDGTPTEMFRLVMPKAEIRYVSGVRSNFTISRDRSYVELTRRDVGIDLSGYGFLLPPRTSPMLFPTAPLEMRLLGAHCEGRPGCEELVINTSQDSPLGVTSWNGGRLIEGPRLMSTSLQENVFQFGSTQVGYPVTISYRETFAVGPMVEVDWKLVSVRRGVGVSFAPKDHLKPKYQIGLSEHRRVISPDIKVDHPDPWVVYGVANANVKKDQAAVVSTDAGSAQQIGQGLFILGCAMVFAGQRLARKNKHAGS